MPSHADSLAFFRDVLTAPQRMCAIAPSSVRLAKLITCEIGPGHAPVIELGAGTGIFTRSLLDAGIPEEKLAIVELGTDFAGRLRSKFPSALVLRMDATRLSEVALFGHSAAGAVISGLPLLSMPSWATHQILDGAFKHLRPSGAFYQFTYSHRCPIPKAILDHLGLRFQRIGRTFANLPPATVYRISRVPQKRACAIRSACLDSIPSAFLMTNIKCSPVFMAPAVEMSPNGIEIPRWIPQSPTSDISPLGTAQSQWPALFNFRHDYRLVSFTYSYSSSIDPINPTGKKQ